MGSFVRLSEQYNPGYVYSQQALHEIRGIQCCVINFTFLIWVQLSSYPSITVACSSWSVFFPVFFSLKTKLITLPFFGIITFVG